MEALLILLYIISFYIVMFGLVIFFEKLSEVVSLKRDKESFSIITILKSSTKTDKGIFLRPKLVRLSDMLAQIK